MINSKLLQECAKNYILNNYLRNNILKGEKLIKVKNDLLNSDIDVKKLEKFNIVFIKINNVIYKNKTLNVIIPIKLIKEFETLNKSVSFVYISKENNKYSYMKMNDNLYNSINTKVVVENGFKDIKNLIKYLSVKKHGDEK